MLDFKYFEDNITVFLLNIIYIIAFLFEKKDNINFLAENKKTKQYFKSIISFGEYFYLYNSLNYQNNTLSLYPFIFR